MAKGVKVTQLSLMETHQLWVLAFRLRHEAGKELTEMRPRDHVKGTLGLLGSVLNELRSRGLQGKLDL